MATGWNKYAGGRQARKDYKQYTPQVRLCRICGKPVSNNGKLCASCADFIKHKKHEEGNNNE